MTCEEFRELAPRKEWLTDFAAQLQLQTHYNACGHCQEWLQARVHAAQLRLSPERKFLAAALGKTTAAIHRVIKEQGEGIPGS